MLFTDDEVIHESAVHEPETTLSQHNTEVEDPHHVFNKYRSFHEMCEIKIEKKSAMQIQYEHEVKRVLDAGGVVNKVTLHSFDGMNGFITTDDIEEDELIMFVPIDATINTKVTEHSETWKYLSTHDIIDKLENSINHIKASIFIMEERRNPSSIWQNYLSMWPTSYSEFPKLYSDEDLALLDGSPVQTFLNTNMSKQR